MRTYTVTTTLTERELLAIEALHEEHPSLFEVDVDYGIDIAQVAVRKFRNEAIKLVPLLPETTTPGPDLSGVVSRGEAIPEGYEVAWRDMRTGVRVDDPDPALDTPTLVRKDAYPRTCKAMHPGGLGRCKVPDSSHHLSPKLHVSKPDRHTPHRTPNWWYTK